MSKEKKQGWLILLNAKKAHYFKKDGRSLCGRWLTFSTANTEDFNHDSPDNCKSCRSKLVIDEEVKTDG